MIYLITDTHLGHGKMVELCARPANFSEKIKHNLDQLKSDDVLIHLGDVFWNSKAHDEVFLNTKFKKWLCLGNHDKASTGWFMSHGWDFVGTRIDLDVFGHKIALSHKPIPDDGWFDFNIHGHYHNIRVCCDRAPFLNEKHRLLSIEMSNYNPVRLDSIRRKDDKILKKSAEWIS